MVASYLEAALEEAIDEPSFFLVALDTVARAQNFSEIAREIGISRKGLYKALSPEGNPSFSTICQVLDQLGLKFEIRPSA